MVHHWVSLVYSKNPLNLLSDLVSLVVLLNYTNLSWSLRHVPNRYFCAIRPSPLTRILVSTSEKRSLPKSNKDSWSLNWRGLGSTCSRDFPLTQMIDKLKPMNKIQISMQHLETQVCNFRSTILKSGGFVWWSWICKVTSKFGCWCSICTNLSV